MLVPAALGSYATAELARLLINAWQTAKPDVGRMLSDPSGVVTRIGDTLVWTGPTGQKVLGGLETLAESQGRIESAVVGIESAKVAMQGTLGVVQSVSIATLGITSLTGAFMAHRLQALNKRIGEVAKAIKDVEGKIDAQHKAHLKSSLQYLREYDDSPGDDSKLRRALGEARHAANIYGTLATDEASGPARLPVLNIRGRFYVISLLIELRCMMSSDDSNQAMERIGEEQQALMKIASACYDQTLKTDPERYLRACFQSQGVNLDLLAGIYQQAKQLGIIDQPQIADANGMFEHVRDKLQKGQGYWNWMFGAKVNDELQKLRYLLACLEETSKIEGLKLLIGDVRQQNGSLSELVSKLREWKDKQVVQERAGEAPPVFAYAL